MTDTDLPAISHLSLESKRKLLVKLARDVLGDSRGMLTLSDDAGDMLVSPLEESSRVVVSEYVRSLTPEYLDELDRLASDPAKKFMTFEEVLNLPSDEVAVPMPR